MRASIFFGLVLIAHAISRNSETFNAFNVNNNESVATGIAIVVLILFLMDFAEFVKNMSSENK